MLTILQALEKTTEFLQNKSIESPRVNAELMLSHILNCKRLELYLLFDRPLTEKELSVYRNFIKRRSAHEPLQYITESVEFYGLEFKVNNSVLIPRPETEILVETIIKNADTEEKLNILDIGTGSGNIAVSLAKNLPNSKIIAIDKSKDALEIATINSVKNNVNEQIEFIKYDILKDDISFKNKFDIIVSNPPYISKNDFDNLEPELNEHEPEIALTDFSDGFIFYKSISEKGKNLLNNNGILFFEMGAGQCSTIKNIMNDNNFKNINVIKDYLNHERVINGVLS